MSGPALDTVTGALDRLGLRWRTSGGQIMAQCPAHEDREPSLSVRYADGKVLLNCKANCDTRDVAAALGMTMADLFDEPAERPERPVKVAEYRYTDEAGRLLFVVERLFPPKRFRQRDAAGNYRLGDTRRVLYRLPEVVEAVQAGRTVYVVEGEKDADRLASIGEVATCNPGGAGKWRDEYSTSLAGARVVVVTDRDDPGRAHAAAVAKSLDGRVGKVEIREPAAGKDVSDHLDAGLALDRLQRPADPADPFPPLVRLDELLARPPRQVRYRIEELWPEGGRFVCNAAWKAGKTTLVGNLVRSLVDGDPFLDRYDVATTGRTIVVLDDELAEDMLADWYRDQDIKHTDRVYVAFLRGRAASLNLLDPATLEVWAARLRAVDAGVILLDCLSPVLAALDLDEYRTPEVRRFLAAFDALLYASGAREGGVIHHAGHNGERGRGASALRDWPDAEWLLVRERPEESGDEPDPAAPRYFKAYGRDVDQPEQRLNYDPHTRRLSIAGASRRAERRTRHVPKVVEYLTHHPGATTNAIDKALTDQDVPLHPAREAREQAVRLGLVSRVPGPGRSCLHYLAATASDPSGTSEQADAPDARGTSPYIGDVPRDAPASRPAAASAGDVPAPHGCEHQPDVACLTCWQAGRGGTAP